MTTQIPSFTDQHQEPLSPERAYMQLRTLVEES